MDHLVCVNDFPKEAESRLGQNARDYFACAADDAITLKQNLSSFSRVFIKPRMLRDVSKRDLSTTVLGKKVQVPIGVAPSAMQKLAHPQGECGSAKAVEKVGGIMILSQFATSGYEELANAAPNARKWFQFCVHKDKTITEGMIRRAERAGFEAMVFSVDAHYVGNRRIVKKQPIKFPDHLNFPNENNDGATKPDMYKMHDRIDCAVTWETVSWLKSISKLPLVLKGIQTPEDARLAVEYGADAVFVSNHGGRQVDSVPTTIDILPSIVRAVGERAEIYVDGGVRRGSDVFKMLALGARMVFVGRPAIWGLAVDGANGVKKVLEILREELDLTMALSGVSDIRNITPDCIRRREDFYAKL